MFKLCRDHVICLHRVSRLLPAAFLLPGERLDIHRGEAELRVLLQPLFGGELGVRLAGEPPPPERPERRFSFLSVILEPFWERLLLLRLHRHRLIQNLFLPDPCVVAETLVTGISFVCTAIPDNWRVPIPALLPP